MLLLRGHFRCLMFIILSSGPKARLLQNGTSKVHIDVVSRKKPNALQATKPVKSTEAKQKPSFQSSSQKMDSKPDLVFVNKEKSVFTDMAFASSSASNGNCVNGESLSQVSSLKREPSDSRTLKVKRRRVVINDSDSDDLDFGDSPAVTKKTVKREDSLNYSESAAITVDSDSDSDFVT